MLWIYLIVLIIFFFGGLLFFLQYILTRNIRKATGRLHELSKDYAAKEEEANQLLQNAQRESKGLVARETQAGQEAKEQLIKEGHEQKEQILKEASQKSAEIAEKAQKNAEFMKKEIDSKIDDRAKEKISDLIHKVIPSDILKETHQKWLDGSGGDAIDLKHLKLPDNVKEATVTSAFPLTDSQSADLKNQLKKKVGSDIDIKAEVDESLLAGFIIHIGSVIVDASLKYKIQKELQG